jgi:hypothetical protein
LNETLPIALAAAVPLRITELQQRGGPTDTHLAMARSFSTVIAEKGDVLLFGGKKGEAARIFNQLAEVLAVMAFAPGGVSFADMHWEAHAPVVREAHAAAAPTRDQAVEAQGQPSHVPGPDALQGFATPSPAGMTGR